MDSKTLNRFLLEARPPIEQIEWSNRQKPCTQAAFTDCWLSNPFAHTWIQFIANQSSKFDKLEIMEALAIIRRAGYFSFTESQFDDREGNKGSVLLCLNKFGSNSSISSKSDPILEIPEMPSDYEQFLASTYWKVVKQRVLGRDRHKCVKCGNRKRLEVHHLTYSHYKDEANHLDTLETLCYSCHRRIHHR